MHIVDLDKSCFLVKFVNEQDYFKTLTGGPWIILDRYLIVHQWDQNFRVSDELPNKLVAWIRFPHLPIQFYHGQILSSLGNLIGRTVKIDFMTQRTDRGKFARIAVEIDLNMPLPLVIELDGCLQLVEYENIPTLCFGCVRVGHDREAFPASSASKDPSDPVLPNENALASPPSSAAPDSFGPWMIASRRMRKPIKESTPAKESAIHKADFVTVKGKGKVSRSGDSSELARSSKGKSNAEDPKSGTKSKEGTVSEIMGSDKFGGNDGATLAGPKGGVNVPEVQLSNDKPKEKKKRGRPKATLAYPVATPKGTEPTHSDASKSVCMSEASGSAGTPSHTENGGFSAQVSEPGLLFAGLIGDALLATLTRSPDESSKIKRFRKTAPIGVNKITSKLKPARTVARLSVSGLQKEG
ncbi:hypothetical protein LINPERHAP1_LOCUS34715 [Linum perenne]